MSIHTNHKPLDSRLSTLDSTQSGFTIIELLIAISIISILFAITITSYLSSQRTARDAQRQTDLKTIQSVLEQYYADQKYYPDKMTLPAKAPDSTPLPLTNQTGAASPAPSATSTYLKSLPMEPNNQDKPYCYLSLTATNQPCDYSQEPLTLCHRYQIFAQLENSSSAQSTNCGGKSYNYSVTSP